MPKLNDKKVIEGLKIALFTYFNKEENQYLEMDIDSNGNDSYYGTVNLCSNEGDDNVLDAYFNLDIKVYDQIRVTIYPACSLFIQTRVQLPDGSSFLIPYSYDAGDTDYEDVYLDAEAAGLVEYHVVVDIPIDLDWYLDDDLLELLVCAYNDQMDDQMNYVYIEEDFYRLRINKEPITEGDYEEILTRVKQICRENGIEIPTMVEADPLDLLIDELRFYGASFLNYPITEKSMQNWTLVTDSDDPDFHISRKILFETYKNAAEIAQKLRGK